MAFSECGGGSEEEEVEVLFGEWALKVKTALVSRKVTVEVERVEMEVGDWEVGGKVVALPRVTLEGGQRQF